jgi:hypothetical protein
VIVVSVRSGDPPHELLAEVTAAHKRGTIMSGAGGTIVFFKSCVVRTFNLLTGGQCPATMQSFIESPFASKVDYEEWVAKMTAAKPRETHMHQEGEGVKFRTDSYHVAMAAARPASSAVSNRSTARSTEAAPGDGGWHMKEGAFKDFTSSAEVTKDLPPHPLTRSCWNPVTLLE